MDILSYAMAKSSISGMVPSSQGVLYIGEVNYYKDLPNNAKVGDAYTVKYQGTSGTVADGREFVWGNSNGTNKWIEFGPDLTQLQEKLVSGTNIKTVNNNSLLGSGDITIIGAEGKSAYDVAVEEGFSGTKAQWLASLVGATGAKGETGARGDTPVKGTDYWTAQDQAAIIAAAKAAVLESLDMAEGGEY